MSHANAVLTPRTRLRLARLVVDQGWTCASAAKMFMVAARTAKKWADRYRAEGVAGMADRSSRPHRCPTKTPEPGRSRSCGCGGDTGSARSKSLVDSPCRHRPCTPCWSGAGSTDSPHRPCQLPAPAPLRARPPRLADPRRRHQVRQHPRRRRLALRRQTAGRQEQVHHRAADRPHGQGPPEPIGTAFLHTVIDDHSRVAYAEICADENAATAIGVLRRAVAWFAHHGVTVERVLSDNGSAYRSHAWRDTCAELAIKPNAPGPTDPRPTARSSASTAPWPTAGPTPASTPQSQPPSALPSWLHFYNHHRPHSAIAGKPPVSRLTNLPGHHT